MKKLRVTLLLFVVYGAAKAQYGNEWINQAQTYFRIPVVQPGIYRISAAELRQAGFAANNVDATTLQLFFRGQEQAIFVAGQADKRLDNEDFIEFYGQGNDGTQDSLLYIPHSAQPHKIYNLYSDTTAYFLTWRLDGRAGKRMDFYQETASNNLSPEAYHLENLLVSNIKSSNHEGMSEGLIYPLGAAAGSQMAYYDHGEGWSGPEWTKNKPNVRELTLENVWATGPAPRLEVHLMGRDHRKHRVEIMAGSQTRQRLLETATFELFYPYVSRQTLAFSDITNNKIFVSTTSRGDTDTQPEDTYSVTYYRLFYPQRFDFQGYSQKYFYLTPNAQNRSLVQIPNADGQARLYDLSDKNNVTQVGTTLENTTLKGVIRNTNTARTLFLTRTSLPVLGVQRVSFRNIDPTKHNFLVVTHRNLLKPAQTYAAYRASAAGGSYDTLTVDMDLLVNQFNYGEFSPLAIKRFVAFMVERGNPQFLFLVGRTTQVDFTRTARDRYTRDMVPTFGWPGSDLMFSQGLKGLPAFVAALPTGRLWTDSPQTVLDYLEKVKQHEATPMNALWRKNVLHLSGGISPFELRQFKGFMDEFKQKSQRQYLGAKVTTITKKTDEAVEYVGITNQINEGAGLVTIFGHSSLSVTDIDIGLASNDVLGYRNKGRYPLIYANGCVLGNFTFGANTYPIDWIAARDRGAVLFLAHSNLAYSFSLKQYGDAFYDTWLGDSLNLSRPFGQVHRQIAQQFLKRESSPIQIADAQQMSLQGDPAVVVFPAKRTDYAISPRDVAITAKNGAPLSAFNDSLRVQMTVANFGVFFRNNKLKIRLLRTSRDGATLAYSSVFGAVAYQDTLYIDIPNDRTQSGLNRFEIRLDPDNEVAEMDEQNNVAAFDFNIPAQGPYPLLPAEYALVSDSDAPTSEVTLVAQAVEFMSRNYIFELDTTARFDSPFRKTQTLTDNLLPTWKVAILPRDSTTYYWRVRYADRPSNDENRWATSSFSYFKATGTGWTQRQPAQFTKATPLQIGLSTTTAPVWSYQSQTTPISGVLNGSSVGAFAQGFLKTQLSIGTILLVNDGNCNTYNPANGFRPESNVIVTALRRDNLRAYSVLDALRCGNPPYVMNTLRDADIISAGLLERYLNAVPQGDFVVLMTSGDVQFDRWPAAAKAKLRELGIGTERLTDLKSGRPYLLIGQKGAQEPVKELFTDPNDLAPSIRSLQLENFTLNSTVGNGQIVSSLVGPANQWEDVKYQISKYKYQISNTSALDVIGVDLQGKETLLLANQNTARIDLKSINARQFPYLRLQLKLANNDVNFTIPAQLQDWLVRHQPVAEGVASSGVITALEKQEGEPFVLDLNFKNVVNVAFKDSVLVQTTLYSAKNGVQTSNKKYAPLLPGESIKISQNVATLGNVGDNRLTVNFNPRQQPEQNFNNNVINLPFTVRPDRLPPILEVAIDGQKIQDGEVVSANPLIVVQLKDENRFLFKRDTTGIDLYLQRADQPLRRVALRGASVRFTPANANNVCQIEYRPGTLPDGLYTLRAQGSDVSGNRTGVYLISFRVINESKVLTINAYPNPFGQLLRFAFVVSGVAAPDEARITLTDLNGKLVKAMALPVRVGSNEWQLNDTSGLAAGTYLYRVVVRKDGQDIPLADGVQPTGKVVLIR